MTITRSKKRDTSFRPIAKERATQISALKNLEVVLVRAENPANIGHAARAMKNFGVSKLVLVDSVPHKVQETYTTGWKAKRILNAAKCYQDLDKVIGRSSFSVGFTTRAGKDRREACSFEQVVPEIFENLRNKKVLLVFGNEKNGLSNSEVAKCHAVARIPASPVYSSLNLSHAVAIVLFSLFAGLPEARFNPSKPEHIRPRPEEFDSLMKSFLEMLILLDYKQTSYDGLRERVFEHLKNFFRRSGLERRELHLFHAFLSRIRQRLRPTR